MKCRFCGGEIPNGLTVCPYCHSEVPKEEKQSVTITNNYYNSAPDNAERSSSNIFCPKCGSSNIKFNREEAGSIGQKSQRIVHHRTVAVCQGCGYTWITDETKPKKNHGCLWWIIVVLFFPISLPIIGSKWFLDNPNIKLIKPIKILILILLWFLYIGVLSGSGNSSGQSVSTVKPNQNAETQAEIKGETKKETKKAADKDKKPETTVKETTSAVKGTEEVTKEKDNQEDAKEKAKETETAAAIEINEALPEGYYYINPEDLQKYSPNLSGVKVYTVSEVSKIENDCIRITLGEGYMMSTFYTSENYTDVLKEHDTVAIYGEVAEYTDYSFMGTSVSLNNCKVFAANKYAGQYKKEASDEALNEYFIVNAEVADISGDITKEEYTALCETADYESILRNPDTYKDKYMKVSGKVDQIIEGWFGTYSIFVVDGKGNKWGVTYSYDEGESHILENDRVTVYGKCQGTANTKTVLGKQVTMPLISGEYIDY